MSDEPENEKPSQIYWNPKQQILPAFGPEITKPKIDYRSWRGADGAQIDSPKFRGPQFTGKIIPPLTNPDGSPIKEGSLQLTRDARGMYIIVDWLLPMEKTSSFATPIMGRPVYRLRASSSGTLEHAKKALHILAEEKKDFLLGLPFDPVQCVDLDGKLVFIGKLALARYARGKNKDLFVIIDTALDLASSGYKELLPSSVKTLKQAITSLSAKAKKTSSTSKTSSSSRQIFTGAPISFDVPAGFGAGVSRSWERECPTDSDASWNTIVLYYAKTGRWPLTASLIWPDPSKRPAEIVEQASCYREEYLSDPSKFYDEWKPLV